MVYENIDDENGAICKATRAFCFDNLATEYKANSAYIFRVIEHFMVSFLWSIRVQTMNKSGRFCKLRKASESTRVHTKTEKRHKRKHGGLHTYLRKLCRVKRENHKRCDTMGFWEDGTDKLDTPLRLLIFNIFPSQNVLEYSFASRVILCY